MRDLNYQLKQLCHRNRDGSYATQAKRMDHLMLIANQLYDLGFRGMKPRSLKQKHVDALVKGWLRQELAVGTIKNRMAVLRWWAEKADGRNVVAASSTYYGITDRQFVTNTSKAKAVGIEEMNWLNVRIGKPGASSVTVSIQREDNAVKLIVEDDGAGMPCHHGRRAAYG